MPPQGRGELSAGRQAQRLGTTSGGDRIAALGQDLDRVRGPGTGPGHQLLSGEELIKSPFTIINGLTERKRMKGVTDVDLEFRRGYEMYIDTRSIGCEKKRRTKNDRQA